MLVTQMSMLMQSKPAAKPSPASAPQYDLPPTGALEHERFWVHLGHAWEADLTTFVQKDLPKLIIVAFITLALVWILRFITGRLRDFANPHLVGAARSAQIRTLATVVSAAGWSLIIFHAVLQSLSILSINVTPLIASAGVAGVAIGFGAQTLVHDMLNGVLILVENQFNVGEVVKIASLTGTVEDMSLRKTVLRDGGDGTMYVVPNSQITTVANLTRDWSQIQVNISVDYRENPDKVIAILTELANAVASDPKYKDQMSGPPSILGIDAFKGSEVIYPVVFKTKVNGQWDVSREFRRRVKIRFDQERMLLGDPQRVYNYPPASSSQPTAQVAAETPAANAAAPSGDATRPAATTVSLTDPTPKA